MKLQNCFSNSMPEVDPLAILGEPTLQATGAGVCLAAHMQTDWDQQRFFVGTL